MSTGKGGARATDNERGGGRNVGFEAGAGAGAGAGTGGGPEETVKASIQKEGGADALNYVNVSISPEALMDEFKKLAAEDGGVVADARKAAAEMQKVPLDDLDAFPLVLARARLQALESGKTIDRRAPMNPFARRKTKGVDGAMAAMGAEGMDPALVKNPLRGRLTVTISVNAALFMVFVQALVANRMLENRFYAPRSENSNIGPSGVTLTDLGGLNTNLIRQGEWIRFFWSMWMHSGWIHIALNVLCQLQYFYMLEPDWGSLRTLLLFWFSALMGNMFSVILDPCKTTVGSSGGLFGLMGGVVPYCLEYWNSIPRPLCILIFSIVTFVVTLLTGLTKTTDSWAHLGGLIGGLLFGFATISNAHVKAVDAPIKKTVKRNVFMRWAQRRINANCKCGAREWIIRVLCWAVTFAIWAIFLVYLLSKYEYQPPGSLTYSGITKCCCCYFPAAPDEQIVKKLANWNCMSCEIEYEMPGERGDYRTWQDVCSEQGYNHK